MLGTISGGTPYIVPPTPPGRTENCIPRNIEKKELDLHENN